MKIFNDSGYDLYRGTEGSAGIDLVSKENILLEAGERTLVKTGIYVQIPEGYFGMLVPRSSLSKKHIYMTNSVGIIDSDYRGEIMASLIFIPPDMGVHTDLVRLEDGERIVQLIILPYRSVDIEEVSSQKELNSTKRGEGGFGSTGV